MFELVYTSSPTQPWNKSEVESLLEISRINNQKSNITGVLLYDGSRFFQLLEGEESAVRHLFDRISLDSRHKDIALFCTGNVAERSFESWAMAYKRAPVGKDLNEWVNLNDVVTSIHSQGGSLGKQILKLIQVL